MKAATSHDVAECEREVIRAAIAFDKARHVFPIWRDGDDIARCVKALLRARRSKGMAPIRYRVVKRGGWALLSVAGGPSWTRGHGLSLDEKHAEKFAGLYGGRVEVIL